jgi:hypothetical protein
VAMGVFAYRAADFPEWWWWWWWTEGGLGGGFLVKGFRVHVDGSQ